MHGDLMKGAWEGDKGDTLLINHWTSDYRVMFASSHETKDFVDLF